MKIAKLDPSEVLLGDLLGEGGFSQVYSVSGIRLDNNHESYEYNDNLQQTQLRTNLEESANLAVLATF
jgi:hypothetical protein